MATYKLRLNSLEPRVDGTVKHDIFVLTQDDAPTSLHKDVLIPHCVLSAALLAGNKAQVIEAYKDAIWDNRNTQPPDVNTSDWTFDLLAGAVGALDACQDAEEWMTENGIDLPVPFTLTSPE